ncbi:3-isopropylmalate dehydratase large subunit [Amphiplicatus metriothermophilus]|uniref:3-isopropylmalate dehydratase large subunit n=1 Tax=Amphiplicatus metriothermophilus TaxID=1519374 RepID=A0A239PZ05_9PROT|nr:3-isopropylmalate dehydratase large subunit [Amphiplicatus metriothermophilus]MBB5519755.1 3-isopropylmalate/(R)-2-methylmalate dehydratase large subunit [Amphiplicatus metriothermophilus]SNT75253.1 3-isopropylmalate/(R)-2-methylmalate dehydratase large subunit [Amphiplicatus metriothermophilus]
MKPQTLFDKVWARHVVVEEAADAPAVLYIDLHLIHEVTSPQAFAALAERGLKVRRPDRTLATLDHSTPTRPPGPDGEWPYASPEAKAQVEALQRNCAAHGIRLLGLDDPRRGIVHVIGPELGATRPGMTIVCGDSHTSTHGAFGALAFGIGTTEVGHVLATQCLLQRRPRTMRVTFGGRLQPGVGAKDMALAMIATIGADGGRGYAIEYAGKAVRSLTMEGRMTLCNMSIEAGARCGMIAPDEKTVEWLEGRELAPKGEAWTRAVEDWLSLSTDEGAAFDREVFIDAAEIRPMATYGVSPDAAAPVDGPVPADPGEAGRAAADYMRIAPGQRFSEIRVDRVFIGSCTNSRLSDLREAAAVLRGRKVKEGVTVLVAPGSEAVRSAAEAEGLHEVFLAAGAEWRLPGCSMCIAMNGDKGEPGELVVSTSNRNFMGRQGKGVRTVLASPATAAASAVEGRIADPRPYLEQAERMAS